MDILKYTDSVMANMPADWLNLTTHRLDIYDENKAKIQFLDQLENLFNNSNSNPEALATLPTSYDYIRLGHPLSCLLEWVIAKLNNLDPQSVISFSSLNTPILAVLRKNKLDNKATQLVYSGNLPPHFIPELIKEIYEYEFVLTKVEKPEETPKFNGSSVFISYQQNFNAPCLYPEIDFTISLHQQLGSVLIANGLHNHTYVAAIQHVRRRETIAMTPANCLTALNIILNKATPNDKPYDRDTLKVQVENSIKQITAAPTKPLIASSGLSIQYAIMMGLIHHANQHHPDKPIKFIVPPNCYGGTNDQARRVAECIANVDIVDLPVDGNNDMVQSVNSVLDHIAQLDAIPYIIAEIPTNPRVEVPNLNDLRDALSKERFTPFGKTAINPVFILDQTFCPNVHFLGEGEVLSTVRTISYASGSKFPSGGLCTAGYCVGNQLTADLMEKIELHLQLCDNQATPLQLEILAQQLPSMNQRIHDAYLNTRQFVNFIHDALPQAKINFVSEELAAQGFTPSVFSLDLPTKGNTAEEMEAYKRKLNNRLINLMIEEIPAESKNCVSYGQLKGCYWTIPATSTQGTTKEGDKDYIVRVSLSAKLDLERHKDVFLKFVDTL